LFSLFSQLRHYFFAGYFFCFFDWLHQPKKTTTYLFLKAKTLLQLFLKPLIGRFTFGFGYLFEINYLIHYKQKNYE